MKLTHKAKEDFIKWHKENYSYISFEKFESEEEFNKHNKCRKVLINALIIEWFDSVGIYITISAYKDMYQLNNDIYFIFFVEYYASSQYKTRQEATEKAIEQANFIYNKMV